MVDRVFDAGNRGQRLGAELGRGGEGSVHALVDRPDLAVKLYALEKLHARGPELRRKVEAQIALWPALQHQPLAWPRLSVFDADEQWIGYAMRRGAGQPLRKLAHPSLSAKYFPGLTRRFITGSLLELLACVQTLHGQGIHLGDVNLTISCAIRLPDGSR